MPLPLQHIGPVDPAGVDSDQHVVGTRHRHGAAHRSSTDGGPGSRMRIAVMLDGIILSAHPGHARQPRLECSADLFRSFHRAHVAALRNRHQRAVRDQLRHDPVRRQLRPGVLLSTQHQRWTGNHRPAAPRRPVVAGGRGSVPQTAAVYAARASAESTRPTCDRSGAPRGSSGSATSAHRRHACRSRAPP